MTGISENHCASPKPTTSTLKVANRWQSRARADVSRPLPRARPLLLTPQPLSRFADAGASAFQPGLASHFCGVNATPRAGYAPVARPSAPRLAFGRRPRLLLLEDPGAVHLHSRVQRSTNDRP